MNNPYSPPESEITVPPAKADNVRLRRFIYSHAATLALLSYVSIKSGTLTPVYFAYLALVSAAGGFIGMLMPIKNKLFSAYLGAMFVLGFFVLIKFLRGT